MAIADVLLPLALDQAYSYRADAGLGITVGDVVRVPFGPREAIGVVWRLEPPEPDGPDRGANLKAIAGKVDWPPLDASMRAFIDWVAGYTMAPRGLVMKMALRNPGAVAEERSPLVLRATGLDPGRLTPQRERVLAALAAMPGIGRPELSRLAQVSTAVINALIDAGAIEPLALPPLIPGAKLDPDHAVVALSEAQRDAAHMLVEAVAQHRFQPILLEGVTGSGKTEVYFEAIAAALRQGRQALILMPEIALTAQFIERFGRRFGGPPAEWHSGVPAARRARGFIGVGTGEVRVAAGARSALFLPFRELGLVIVDEEHEAAYKQEEGVTYHARDMAIVRAQLVGCPIVLASATPSIETMVNVERGRFRALQLPKRFGGRAMPKIAAIDLRRAGPRRGEWIAPALEQAVRRTVERGEQAILFLNRRGFAPLTLCRACGHRWQCPNCTAWLVEHRFRKALVCHHCGHTERSPSRCIACDEEDSLSVVGPGIERLAEEAARKFDGVRQIVLSSDYPGGTARLAEELEAVAKGRYGIVIGTQLIAKGHHFPDATLAGVIDADVGLANGDPRAAERTFQLLQQVTGRAGRGRGNGEGLLQTYQPEHPVMQALLSGDTERFYAQEIATRRDAGLPPFGRLASLIVMAKTREEAETHGRKLARAGAGLGRDPTLADVILLGPAEAPIAIVRGIHRFRLLVKASRSADIQGYIRRLIADAGPMRGSLRVHVDIDPVSFL